MRAWSGGGEVAAAREHDREAVAHHLVQAHRLGVVAQVGAAGVGQPAPGVLVDQLVYYHFHNGQPATYYTHSSLVAAGATALSRADRFGLGTALSGGSAFSFT